MDRGDRTRAGCDRCRWVPARPVRRRGPRSRFTLYRLPAGVVTATSSRLTRSRFRRPRHVAGEVFIMLEAHEEARKDQDRVALGIPGLVLLRVEPGTGVSSRCQLPDDG